MVKAIYLFSQMFLGWCFVIVCYVIFLWKVIYDLSDINVYYILARTHWIFWLWMADISKVTIALSVGSVFDTTPDT